MQLPHAATIALSSAIDAEPNVGECQPICLATTPMAAAQLIAHHFTNESLFMFAAIPAAFSSLMIAGLAKTLPRS
jgi:hypothetical protein